MVRIVVEKSQFFCFSLQGNFNGLFPTAVAPSFLPFKLFGCVLSIVNQKIRILGKFHYIGINGVSVLYRIHAEERILSQDARWSAYAASVRHRLLPGLW